MTEPDATRDRAREGLEHLQAAARELIAAARAGLDAAEDLIDDPEVVKAMVGAAGRVGEVLRTVSADRSGRFRGSDDPEDDDSTGPATSQVERIVIH